MGDKFVTDTINVFIAGLVSFGNSTFIPKRNDAKVFIHCTPLHLFSHLSSLSVFLSLRRYGLFECLELIRVTTFPTQSVRALECRVEFALGLPVVPGILDSEFDVA